MVNKDGVPPVFILTYGRAGPVSSDKAFRESGYTGDIYYVISSDDPQREMYQKRYGDAVLVFAREDYLTRCDAGHNAMVGRGVFYARNAVYDLARTLGYREFIQSDDDVVGFFWRFNGSGGYARKGLRVRDIDRVLMEYVQFYREARISVLSFVVAGAFFGGPSGSRGRGPQAWRAAQAVMLCSSERPVAWRGWIAEDMIGYCGEGWRGNGLFLMSNLVYIGMRDMKKGGMSEEHRTWGGYVEGCLLHNYVPGFVRLVWHPGHHRFKPHVSWDNAVPKIVRCAEE